MRFLRKSKEPIPTKLLKAKIWAHLQGAMPPIKKGEIGKTLRILRKAKVLSCKNSLWSVVEEK
jgi:hypothetical protein